MQQDNEKQEFVYNAQSRERVRKQLEADVEAFLSSGGEIEEVDMHVTADPPTKPVSRYGGRPI